MIDSSITCPAGFPLVAGRASEWSDEEHPEWEPLNYVAQDAYERATDNSEGLDDALEARGLEG